MLKSLVTVSRVTFSAGHTGNLKSREKIWRTKKKKKKRRRRIAWTGKAESGHGRNFKHRVKLA